METPKNAANHILFVDDEENILSALKRELRPWAKERSIEIETSTSAQTALDLIEQRPEDFAVVVSDLRMPGMKGSDFLAILKERRPDIVTILLTGFSELEEVIKAVKAGIFSYLLKPWDGEYLASELDKALDSYRVKRENSRYRLMLEEELRWAGEMQRTLLKPNPLKAEGVDFRSSWRPVPGLYCGGDYYDVIALAPGRYLLLIGDVAGHGIRGALVTGILKAVIYPEYIRSIIGKHFSPGAFLAWLNERLNFELRKTSGLLVTFFAGVIDHNDMSFIYANAGQPHPFIIRNGVPNELPVSGSALGFATSVMYTENYLKFEVGDVFFAYTDGLIEIGASEQASVSTPIKDILSAESYGADYHKRIMDAALAKTGKTGFTDDLTIMTARIE
jgi:sigma-B regulation protein RsbU (phosphoserine phosphatase)